MSGPSGTGPTESELSVSGSSSSMSGHGCSISATLDVVGDRWSLLILRDVFRGTRRFSRLHEDLGIAKNLLADRLLKLVEHGVLRKVPYQERPARYEYRLTEKGADLSTALIALMRWGDRWYSPGEAPVVLVHDTCGSVVDHTVRCSMCEVAVPPGQIRSQQPATNPTPHY